jgi:hypothetical protein
MFSGLIANKNKIRRYEHAKEQSRKQKTLRTRLLCSCLSVSSLKKSQPKQKEKLVKYH